MSLATFAAIAAAGFIGACGGKVIVDGENPDGTGGGGGAGGGFAIVASSSVVSTGVVGTTSSPSSTGANMIASVSVGTGPGSVVASSSVGVGGAGPGSSSVASSSVASTGVASSSATGVIDSCNTACDKAQTCGLDFCGQFGINCGNVPPQSQCGLDCISNGSCGDIAKLAMQNFATPLGACFLGCQGMGPGAAASVGSTGSGPPPMACQQCTFQSCGGPIFQCNAKKGPGSCSKWLQCAQGCGQDSMCLFGCDAQFPNAAPEYDAVYSCLCNSCDAQCPAENACGHLGPVPPGP
jgi:hypothetical protein